MVVLAQFWDMSSLMVLTTQAESLMKVETKICGGQIEL